METVFKMINQTKATWGSNSMIKDKFSLIIGVKGERSDALGAIRPLAHKQKNNIAALL